MTQLPWPTSRLRRLSYLATQHALRHERGLTLYYARQAHEIAEQYHVGYYLAWAGMLLAWANAKQSPGADAVVAKQAGVHATGALASTGWTPSCTVCAVNCCYAGAQTLPKPSHR